MSVLNWLACYLQGLPSGIAGDAPVLRPEADAASSDEELCPVDDDEDEERRCWWARVTPSCSASSAWSDWWT